MAEVNKFPPRNPRNNYISIKLVKEMKCTDAELSGTVKDLDGTLYVTVIDFG